MNSKQQNTEEKMIEIKCECGKTLAYKKISNGEIIVKCRTCKRHQAVYKPNN